MAISYDQAKTMMSGASYIYYDVPSDHNPLQHHYMIYDGTKMVLGFSAPEIGLESYQLKGPDQ